MREIILGPPGTGKTTTLIDEVEREIRSGVPPDRIAYISFTRRAAEEAVVRAGTKFNLQPEQLPHFRTLHSMCFRALGLSSDDVFEGRKVQDFADWASLEVNGKTWSEDGLFLGFAPGDRILFMENLARIRCMPLRQQFDEADDEQDWDEVDRVSRALFLYKAHHSLLDFTDMLQGVIDDPALLPDVDVLMVDEAQDLSPLQWGVVDVLARRARRVVVGGDDDQAIYRWAGASAETLVDMPGDARVLGQSYRVPVNIQLLANEIIRGVPHRRPKTWRARNERGRIGTAINVEEVDLTGGWRDDRVQPILILARNTYVLRDKVAPELRSMGILYDWCGRPSLPRAVARAVVTWERLRRGDAVPTADARVALSFATRVSRSKKEMWDQPDEYLVTMEMLERERGLRTRALWSEALDLIPTEDAEYVVAARQRGEHILAEKPRVRLSTIHAAKGGEANHVVLMQEMARRTYDEMEDGGEDDERRTWYVAVTRARERLTVVDSERTEACPWV